MPSNDQRPLRRALTRLAIVLLVAAAPVGVYFAPSSSVDYPKAWDPRVAGIAHFVEGERGLAFKHPVAVRFLADKAFAAKVKDPAPTADERKQLTDFLHELRALGLVTGNPDLFKAQNDLVSSDVVGVYMPEEKTLYVRGTTLTPYVRATAAHELTHALQDQYFDLTTLRKDVPGGDDTAATALIEGDAVRIEDAYVAQLDEADQKAYEQAASSGDSGSTTDVPQVLKDRLALPYALGPVLLDTLVADGGNSAVDKAFRSPPQAEAQVVDPRAYPTGFRPEKLGRPALPPGAKALGKDEPFGQVTLLEVLGSRLGYTPAWTALQGWSGDVSRTYQQGSRTCVAIDVRMRDERGSAALGDAMRAWARSGEQVTVSGRTASLRACDPGATATGTTVQPAAFEVLTDRAGLIHLLMRQEGQGFIRSRCVADAVIQGLGEKLFVAANANDLTAAQQTQVRDTFAGAVHSC